jgi:hypothetical protein
VYGANALGSFGWEEGAEAMRTLLFCPPNPPVSSREEATRAWSLRVAGAPRLDCSAFVSHWRPHHACSLTASFFCSVGGSVTCKTPSFNEVAWGLFLQCR